MVEHHSIIGEGKTNGISYIEFVITNDIFILWVLTGNLTFKHPAVPRIYLHSQGSAKTSIKQEEDTKIWWNGDGSNFGLGTFFHGHAWEGSSAGLL